MPRQTQASAKKRDRRKSRRQVRFLLSSGSPLKDEQRKRLKSELHTGAVKVSGKRRTRAKKATAR